MSTLKVRMFCVLSVLFAAFSFDLAADDWPCYKANPQRTGVTKEALALPLAPVWRLDSAESPTPAWPEDGYELNRMDFDYAFQPVVAAGVLYYGSSVDDSVHALDAATGREKWTFTTGGPIRFAPHVAGGRCYAASDDGSVYCLDASTGALVWQFRCAANARRIPGNGRMISRWPCRTGVLVDKGIVYVTAGMWPSEGVFIYALDANTGKVVWCNDTSGCIYVLYPHQAHAMGGIAPQGYLLAAHDVLLVPTGRSVPAGYSARNGKLLYYNPGWTNGGSWATIDGMRYYNQDHGRSTRWHAAKTEAEPHKLDVLSGGLVTNGGRSGRVYGYYLLPTDDRLYAACVDGITAFEKVRGVCGKAVWKAPHGRVYALAFAGDTLLVGGRGTVTALSGKDGKQVWRADVDAQARGFAVSDGRLFVATQRGTIYCFSKAAAGEPAVRGRIYADRTLGLGPAVGAIRAQVAKHGLTRGYALVLGEPDTRLAQAIAAQTDLSVIAVLTDEAKARAARQQLGSQCDLYGRRLTVDWVGDLTKCPYPQFSANLIVVGGTGQGLSGTELYRLLRPCGGVLCFTGEARKVARRLAQQPEIPEDGMRPDGDSVVVVRGKLPGAFDWNSKVTADERVKWPLELLWFGQPGPELVANRRLAPPLPIAANGRMISVGEYNITAVDAYNGTILWSKEPGLILEMPATSQFSITADDDFVHIRGKDVRLALDAQTGEVAGFTGTQESTRFDLAEPRTFPWKIDEKHHGTVTLRKTETALEITLATVVPWHFPKDVWNLYFDSRPAEARSLLYDRGAFQVFVTCGGRVEPGAGPVHPELTVKSEKRQAGSHLVVTLPWAEVRRVAGAVPADFTFEARLLLFKDRRSGPIWHTVSLFGRNYGFTNYGWATFVLDPAKSRPGAMKLAGRGDLRLAAPKPEGARDWQGRRAYDLKARVTSWARVPKRQPNADLGRRSHPLIGEETSRIYQRAHGCGGVIQSAWMDFFRSGTVGFYDLADDSGLRNFSGVRPGCAMSMIPALGVLLSEAGSGGCICSYNFEASLAMAPVTVRTNEDWAVFFDTYRTGFVRQLALNLGAPGDRRDGHGLLWLGYPRPFSGMGEPKARSLDLIVPSRLQIDKGFGEYHVNADRVPVAGTDSPWLYTNGIAGRRRMVLDLELMKFGLVALGTKRPPAVDGALDDACWDDQKTVPITTRTGAETGWIWFRQDARNLYIAYREPATIDRRGQFTPWKKKTKGRDAPVWDDDSFSVKFTDPAGDKCLVLGVSASGARYDGLWQYVDPFPTIDIPKLDGITVDGKADDWGDRGFRTNAMAERDLSMRAPDDFDPSFRLAWNEAGLLVLAQVRDDKAMEQSFEQVLERGDAIEIYVAPKRGAKSFFQLITTTGQDPHYPEGIRQRQRNGLVRRLAKVQLKAGKMPGGYVVEMLIPFKDVGLKPALGLELAMQVICDDMDRARQVYSGYWHPDGRPTDNPDAFHHVRLAREASAPILFRRSDKPVPRKGYLPVPPYPWPLRRSTLGAKPEDKAFNCEWTSGVKADPHGFTVEMAVPWKTLESVGLSRDSLLVNPYMRQPLSAAPSLIRAFGRLLFSEGEGVPPRPYTVRLHFAELDDVAPGERVFDVKLQGETVLKDFDIVRAAGGRNSAIMKEFKGVKAGTAILLDMVPKAQKLTRKMVPELCAVEVTEEGAK